MIYFSKSLLRKGWLYIAIVAMAACQSQVEKPTDVALNKFSDSVIVRIHDLQDKRDTRALLDYFDHENPKYREEAALAMASVQDTAAIPMLAQLLDDRSAKVRKAAAYALGQSYDSAAVQFLARALQYEDSIFVKKELLEALGKVVTQPQVSLLYNRTTNSDLEKEGLAWGLYRAGIRNVYDGVMVEQAIAYLSPENTYDTRLAAAHFLSRIRKADLTPYQDQIVRSAAEDSAANVRMASAAALRKAVSPKVLEALTGTILKNYDYRVRVNTLRSLSPYDYADIRKAIFESIEDKNRPVAIAAAELLNTKATADDTSIIIEEALKSPFPRVKAILWGTALRFATDQASLVDRVKQEYNESKDPYYKAELLTALSNALPAYDFLTTATFAAKHPAIATAGISALASLRALPDFPENLQPAFADIFKQAMLSGDIAMVAISAEVLSEPAYHFKDNYDSSGFLYEARTKLSLPKDNEALQILNKTIAYFEGKEEIPETKNEYNHPIDWDLVKTIAKDQKVLISTEKGDITIRLLVEAAPGSVANFVSLAKSGYFQGKNFHRMVPNFVIQGGCNRGDGYGGEDYSIRSEFANLHYREGSVGMASAGKDTEGTQWFITHSPTPHLDGRYTIFAQVTDGMEVVHQLEVGDPIVSMELLDQ